MSDISKCTGDGCALRDKCQRYTAEASEWQSWVLGAYSADHDFCELFLSNGTAEESGEKCQRCGEIGEDRRTLQMACFYAMEEMGIPFEQVFVTGKKFAFKGTKEIRAREGGFPPLTVPEYAKKASGKVDAAYYLLRVCKECRSDWMATIKNWFFTPPTVREGCGTGIFVRELGACREITLEEWERRRAERKDDDPHMPKPNVED